MTYWVQRKSKPSGKGIDAPLPPLTADDITTEECRELWQEVMLNTFREAGWEDDRDVEPRLYVDRHNARSYALTFLQGTSEGFDLICQAAGMDPGVVLEAAQRKFGDSLHAPCALIDMQKAGEFLSADDVGSVDL